MNVEDHPSHLVVQPADGIPPVVATPRGLEQAMRRLEGADGPLALDTERASGFRYHDNAYLVQMRRGDEPAVLLDPVAFDGEAMAELQSVIGRQEWVLHAATQDLPSLHELGLSPAALFDTELGARLLNLPHVGLGGLLDDLFGIHLKKEHSAADWSRRPLPEEWLAYAALDVEYLVELRDEVERLLTDQGKLEIARQEFAAEMDFEPRQKPGEPWRRTSGITAARTPRQLRIVRELWNERDALARQRDLSPHRLIPDRAIMAAATNAVRNEHELLALREFNGRGAHSELRHWWAAVQRARASQEPISVRVPHEGVPHHRSWGRQHPEADQRLRTARSALIEIAQAHDLPVENLLQPRVLRELAWETSEPIDAAEVAARLAELGARPWQTELTAAPIAEAFREAASA
ncbi:HRDC domain-containing protein [Pseudoclavibacter sp. CFCC 14310]|uniref:HRDC domain-containing protein n=1 Tax=Pseudoclavibacter sp. CFCC 14310 TaxID=2615180 RepID=UPI001CE3B5DC|nr:HRDC domain-containing protein [Pseudoclavibacter sp. CFCC 14310]